MNVSYKRDLNYNYMVMICGGESTEGYEIKMLMENDIPGFLPLSIRYVDGECMIYYEISSKQSMNRIYQHTEIGYEDLHILLFQFHKMLKTAEEYLINVDCILIDPEYIYMNIDTKELSVCFYPQVQCNAKEAFQKLAEYLLDRVNHHEEQAVMLAYKIYKNTRNTNFVLEELLELMISIGEKSTDKLNLTGKEFTEMEEHNRTEKKDFFEIEDNYNCFEENREKINIEKTVRNEKDRKDDTNEKIDTSKDKAKKWYGILLGFFLMITSMVYLKAMNLLPAGITHHQYLILLGIGGMGMAGCAIKLILDQARKKLVEEEREKEDEVRESWQEKDIATEYQQTGSVETEYTEKIKGIKKKQEYPEKSEDSIKIYNFLTTDCYSKNMVAEESVYTVGVPARNQTHMEEQEYVGNTMLLGSYRMEAQRKITGTIKEKTVTFSLEQLPVTIGKKEGYVDIAISDQSISRMHARFFEKDGKVFLEDLNSTNGTFKNHVRLEANETVEVEPEDEIAFAKIVFTYH